MSKTQAIEQTGHSPFIFGAVKWYAYIFASMYVLYGGIKIALAVLDRSYTGMMPLFFFGALGIAQFLFAFAFRDRRKFGWYGLVIINALVVALSLISLRQQFSVVWLIFSALAVVALFTPSIKERFSL